MDIIIARYEGLIFSYCMFICIACLIVLCVSVFNLTRTIKNSERDTKDNESNCLHGKNVPVVSPPVKSEPLKKRRPIVMDDDKAYQIEKEERENRKPTF